jgi:hypothetical protein
MKLGRLSPFETGFMKTWNLPPSPNGITWRSSVPNFTQMGQKITKLLVEIHVNP